MTSLSVPGSPESEEASTRERLIRAAVEAFGASHYERVSVRDIERRAGVNRGLAAYHFRTKEALWQAAALFLMERFHEEMLPYRLVLRAVSPEERARVMFRIYVNFSAKCPEFFRIVVMEGARPSERTRWLAREQLSAVINFFHQLTDTVGDLDAEEEAAFTFMYMGAASMIFATPAICKDMFGVDPTDPEFIEHFADAVAHVDFYGAARQAQHVVGPLVAPAEQATRH